MKIFKKRPLKDYIIYSAIIAVGILLDQISKMIVVSGMELYDNIPVIDGVLHWNYITNTGALAGSFSDNRWVFMSVSTVAILLFLGILYLGHADSPLMGIGMALVTSGGIGNMIDRTFSGAVVDFIQLPFVPFPFFGDGGIYWGTFPTFNIADCFVTVGAPIMLFALLRSLLRELKEEKNKKGGAK